MSSPLATSSYILTFLILVTSVIILTLTATLSTWTNQSIKDYVNILIASGSHQQPQQYSILAFPSVYNSYGLTINIIPGAGGTIDAILLFVCFGSIDYIYRGRRAYLAKAAKESARRGMAPTWLWGITIFIVAFSVARSFVGFVGPTVGYYSSASFSVPLSGNIDRDSDGAYISPDGKGFSAGAWVCQVKNYILPNDAYAGRLNNLCGQEQAARWLTLPLFLCYSAELVVVVMRFRSENGSRRDLTPTSAKSTSKDRR